MKLYNEDIVVEKTQAATQETLNRFRAYIFQSIRQIENLIFHRNSSSSRQFDLVLDFKDYSRR